MQMSKNRGFPGVKKSNIGLKFVNGFNMWPMKSLN